MLWSYRLSRQFLFRSPTWVGLGCGAGAAWWRKEKGTYARYASTYCVQRTAEQGLLARSLARQLALRKVIREAASGRRAEWTRDSRAAEVSDCESVSRVVRLHTYLHTCRR